MGLSGTCLRLVAVQLLLLMVANASLPTDHQIAKPGCPTECGELKSIPYPFGTKPGCFLNEDFFIDCVNNSIPRIPFQGSITNSSSLIVTNINMEGRLQVQSSVSQQCYDEKHMKYKNTTTIFEVGQAIISDTQNKFTVIGCDSYGYIQGRIGKKKYRAGCISSCARLNDVTDGSCSGFGCCQIDIPKDLKRIRVEAYSFLRHKYVTQFNPCSYAFVIEDSQFRFSSSNLSSITETVPTAVDWAITRQGKCEEAKYNPSYACKENSFCDDQTTANNSTGGYLCKCLHGYKGNPYLSHGCQGVGLGFVMLLVLISWIYIMMKKRRLIKLKEKFFQQNGGFLLQQQLSKRSGTCGTARIFNAEELQKATNNFDEKRIIGKGGYGTVYKGFLTDNNPVAIKKSKIVDQSQIEQFINEKVVSFDRPEHERSLVIYFLFLLKQSSLFEILENGIVTDDNREQMREVAELARRCLMVNGEERPTMKEVAMELEGLRRMNTHLWDNVEVNIEETEHLLFETSNACDGSNSNVAYDSMKDHTLVAFDGGRGR
ncbi:hypothetical protein QYF36_013959 [Acer negundo]|nr:hypothetical protein QYF36_013959 [Acer negundo]